MFGRPGIRESYLSSAKPRYPRGSERDRSPARRRSSRDRDRHRSRSISPTRVRVSDGRSRYSPDRRVSPERRRPSSRGERRHRSAERHRSGSAMSISDGEDDMDGFKRSYDPDRKKKTIKITVNGHMGREESPEHTGTLVFGHRIRNAPPMDDKKRKSRWDAKAQAFVVPDTMEILERQGVKNPAEVMNNINRLPSMADQMYKVTTDDDTAVQEQLRLLAQQDELVKMTVNLPPYLREQVKSKLDPSKLRIPPPKLVDPNAKKEKKKEELVEQPPIASSISVSDIKRVSQLTMPPPGMFDGMSPFPPPGMGLPPPFMLPPGAPIPGFPMGVPPTLGMPMTSGFPPVSTAMASIGPPQMMAAEMNTPIMQPPPVIPQPIFVDPTERLFQARAELYKRDLNQITNIPALLEYLWSQGFDRIPPEDPPLLFNEVVKKRDGILGVSALYQIICYQHPELETYYCGMCNHWTTVSEMFSHLTADMHRMNFLFRNYKVFHQKAQEHESPEMRSKFLQFVCKKVQSIEGSGEVVNRMKCILNVDDIRRIWPDYHEYVDHSWKVMSTDDFLLETSGDSVIQTDPTKVEIIHKEAKVDRPRSRGGHEKSKEREKARESKDSRRPKETERKPTSSSSHRDARDTRDRHRSRSRSRERRRSREAERIRERRSKSRSPKRITKSPVKDDKDWEKKTSQFLAQLGNTGLKSALKSVEKHAKEEIKKRSNEEVQQGFTRKALGVLMELQTFQDQAGHVEKSMVYAVAEEMGLSAAEVDKSKIIQQGLKNFNVVETKPKEKPKDTKDILRDAGLSANDMKELLSKIGKTTSRKSPPKEDHDVSLIFPTPDSEEALQNNPDIKRLKAQISELKEELNVKNISVKTSNRIRSTIGILRKKLEAEYNRQKTGKGTVAPPKPVSTYNEQLPGAWGLGASSFAASPVNRTPAAVDKPGCDPAKVEREWTDYYLKNPENIGKEDSNDYDEEAYDSYYGVGTYKIFMEAKKRAAMNARRLLSSKANPRW